MGDGIGHYDYIVDRRQRAADAMKRRGASIQGIARLHGRIEYPVPVGQSAVVVPIVKIPQTKPSNVDISDELKAEIALYAFKVVEEMLAHRRKEFLLASAPISLSERPTAREVVEIVALHSDRSVDEFLGARRARDIAWPRQIATLLLKQVLPHLSLLQIGTVFGGRDHTSVMAAVKRAHWHLEQDDAMAQLYRRSRATIEAKWPQAFK